MSGDKRSAISRQPSNRVLQHLLEGVPPVAAGIVLLVALVGTWAARVTYPFDLEWMEGGMLAHAWRLHHGQPLYVRPEPDFVPFLYPPGYSALVAALAEIFPLGPPLGRVVSITSTVAAAAAIAFGVRRAGGTSAIAFGAACAFLGTFPQSGAFYDLVRPDALAIALGGWAVVLALEPRRSAAVAAGLLLAAAYVTKHNLAGLGLPILLGLWLRDRRDALAFAAASIGPALALTGLLQWRSDGLFLTYLLEVPRTHVMIWERGRIDTPREWGTALPLAMCAVAVALVLRAARRRGAVPLPLAAIVPVTAGTLCAWQGTYVAPPPEAEVYNVPAATAFFAMGAAPFALAIPPLGALLARIAGRPWPRPSWRAALGIGVGVTAAGLAWLMRVHDGGFVNVHVPLFWCAALALGVLLARWRDQLPTFGLRFALGLLLAAELLWSAALIDRERLSPTAKDVEIGWRFVEEIRKVEGPVLSPFAAWLPVYAGRPPSVHAMAIWDLNRDLGPLQDDLARIERALRERHWRIVLGGNQRFYGDLTSWYVPTTEIAPPDAPVFWPRTGWAARPWRVMLPSDASW